MGGRLAGVEGEVDGAVLARVRNDARQVDRRRRTGEVHDQAACSPTHLGA